MDRSGRRALVITIVVALLFVLTNLVNTVNKAGDFDAYYEAGRRVVSNQPLYEGSGIATGFVGPPAQALLFVPFAGLGLLGSRLAWYAINLALLWYAVTTWLGLLSPTGGSDRTNDKVRARSAWRRGSQILATRWAALPLLAIAFPLQTQFEHQNLNVVLLALAAYGADALILKRPAAGGAALGIAAALKIYPVLALIWLAVRRQWLAFGAGVTAATALTIAPMLLRGRHGYLTDVADFQALAGSGWPTRRANQSLVAMWGRYVYGEDPGGYAMLTTSQPVVLWLVVATALIVLAPLALVAWRGRPSAHRLIEELACVSALAILVSPIAWEHYWTGFFPICLLLVRYASDAGPVSQTRWARASFWIAVVGFTVLTRPFLGWSGAQVVRAWSLMTWAGVLVCATLAGILASRARESEDVRS